MLSSIAGEREVASQVEFYLRPPLAGIGLLDFKTIDRVESSAYEYALKALERWSPPNAELETEMSPAARSA
jgi:hypothetical protein